ncbi:MAG TPA: glutathione S-transferase family protein [Solirubrobacterales bacterium]|nr:glutathione S-transferase family protein [Solirubrobacterales bacterium]
MLLYDSAISGNCYKVRLLFALLGIEYERREVDVIDRSGRAELLGDLNPGLRVPTLVLDDGRPLAESDAILVYFGEGTEYLPEDRYERAQVLQWMFFEQYSHEPNIAVLRFWTHAGIKPEPREALAKFNGGLMALEAMDRHLSGREFFVGAVPTVADLALYAYTHVAPEGGFELDRYPAIGAWLARVSSLPGYISIDD